MPHFHFSFHDGSRIVLDAHVLTLRDRDAARSRAEAMVRKLMSVTDHEDARVWADWRLEVRDDEGENVATVRFMSESSCSGNEDAS
jgi:hypothetical protein